jgi:hypothetical protein
MPLFKHAAQRAAVRQSVGVVTRIALLLVLPLLAACGGSEPGAGPATTGTDAPTPETGDAITAADSGRSFTLAPGDETSLRLSSEYVWSEPSVSGGALQLSPVDYFQDPGFSEWLVRAAAPGTATISSLGEPACAGQHGCPDEPLRFRVTITVAE